jgi:hypothetical protein
MRDPSKRAQNFGKQCPSRRCRSCSAHQLVEVSFDLPHGIRTESIGIDTKTTEILETFAPTGDCNSLADRTLGGFHEFPCSMCKIGKLSFVAGAEIPKRYVG